MNRSRAALLSVALALAIGACGDDNDPKPEPAGDATITYSKSGGVAGISQRIEIAADGEAVIETGTVDTQTETLDLSQSQVAGINEALDDAGFAQIEVSGEPTGCADCFEYEITRGGHTVSFDDTTFPNELGAAITELEKLAVEKGTGY